MAKFNIRMTLTCKVYTELSASDRPHAYERAQEMFENGHVDLDFTETHKNKNGWMAH